MKSPTTINRNRLKKLQKLIIDVLKRFVKFSLSKKNRLHTFANAPQQILITCKVNCLHSAWRVERNSLNQWLISWNREKSQFITLMRSFILPFGSFPLSLQLSWIYVCTKWVSFWNENRHKVLLHWWKQFGAKERLEDLKFLMLDASQSINRQRHWLSHSLAQVTVHDYYLIFWSIITP
jgi:hypothetical protein